MLKDAINEEILSSRALDYRRNAIASGAVLALLYHYPGINYAELSFFGIKPPPAEARDVVFGFVWVQLLYHAVFFAYYSSRDVRRWLTSALEVEDGSGGRPYLPEWPMFFGIGPKKPQHQHQSNGAVVSTWKLVRGGSAIEWHPVLTNTDPLRQPDFYTISMSAWKGFREKFWWFLVVDVGVPVICFLMPLFQSLLS